MLAGKKSGEKIGRLTPEQAEIARLRRQLDVTEQRLETTGVALETDNPLQIHVGMSTRMTVRTGPTPGRNRCVPACLDRHDVGTDSTHSQRRNDPCINIG